MRFNLRPYQEQAIAAIEERWEAGDRATLLVQATGTGKTIVMAGVTEDAVRDGGRVLILAHRGELLQQAADKLQSSTGLRCSVEKAEDTSVGTFERVTVGSVQTLCREKRLRALGRDRFTHILIDECHHAVSSSYQAVLDYFAGAKVLGVTATADRGDRQNLGKVFDSLAFEYNMPEAIKDGYLCPIKAQTVPLQLDISNVSVRSGDWAADELGTALDPYLPQIAQEMKNAGLEERKTVVFLPLIKTSQKFCRLLNECGFRAVEVNGQSEDRAKILKDFDNGKYDVLCNSLLLTEGWDCPSVDCIVNLRPTKSRALYCLDESTEVLTRDGWRSDAEVGDEVLAFDPKTGKSAFSPVVAKVRRKLREDEYFCSLSGQSSDIRVTNKHRMLYDNKRRGGWKFTTAEHVASLRDGAYIPVSGHGAFSGVPLTDDELMFIGWVMTDGSINKSNNAITITQGTQHSEYCEEITRCIEGCGFKYTRAVRKRVGVEWNQSGDCMTWTISKGMPRGRDKDKTGWRRLEPYISKDMSPALFDMSERQFAVMLEAIYHADGAKSHTKTYHISKGNRTFIERLQAMAIQRGYRAGMSVESPGVSRKSSLFTVHIKKQDFVKVGSTFEGHSAWVKEPHSDEMCWCVETEMGTVFTRRNGFVAAMGNCQIVGRGTRLSPETGKTDLLLLDFLWMTERLELVRPAALVTSSREVVQKMTAMVEQAGCPVDLQKVESKASDEVVAEREEALAKQLAEQRKKKAKLVNPLQYEMSIAAEDLSGYIPEFAWEMAPATDKQKAALEKYGIDASEISNAGKASKLLDRVKRRRDSGLSSPKQIRLLERRGFQHVGTWSMEAASSMISRISASGWRIPSGVNPATYVPSERSE